MNQLERERILYNKGYIAGLKYGIETLEKRLRILIPQESGIVKELIEELKEELNGRK